MPHHALDGPYMERHDDAALPGLPPAATPQVGRRLDSLVVATPMTCRQPDRDEPRLVCGYPLPCPWHTIQIGPYGTSGVAVVARRLAEAASRRDARAAVRIERKLAGKP